MEPNTDSHLRSIIKGLTWRIIASTTIFGITLFSTGEMSTAVAVTSIEFPSKLLLYYFHERAWLLVPRGSVRRLNPFNKKM
jgi:uncharacterized membrane protein